MERGFLFVRARAPAPPSLTAEQVNTAWDLGVRLSVRRSRGPRAACGQRFGDASLGGAPRADTLHVSKNRDPSPVLPLAPRDLLVREIQAVLKMVRPHLEDPVDPDDPNRPAEYDGYCGAACEAYLHLYEGSRSDLTVKHQTFTNWRGRRTGSHWWLEGPKGVIDLTLGPRDH